MTRYHTLRGIVWISFLLSLILAGNSRARGDVVAFDSENWDLDRAVVTEHLEQTCIMGTARLKDIDFSNCVIEYDMAVDGRRCYPGVRFRVQAAGDFEEFYVRPHHSNDPAAREKMAQHEAIASIKDLPSVRQAAEMIEQDPRLMSILNAEGGVSAEELHEILDSPTVLRILDETSIAADVGPMTDRIEEALNAVSERDESP